MRQSTSITGCVPWSVSRSVGNAFVRQSTPSHLLAYLALLLSKDKVYKDIKLIVCQNSASNLEKKLFRIPNSIIAVIIAKRYIFKIENFKIENSNYLFLYILTSLKTEKSVTNIDKIGAYRFS